MGNTSTAYSAMMTSGSLGLVLGMCAFVYIATCMEDRFHLHSTVRRPATGKERQNTVASLQQRPVPDHELCTHNISVMNVSPAKEDA